MELQQSAITLAQPISPEATGHGISLHPIDVGAAIQLHSGIPINNFVYSSLKLYFFRQLEIVWCVLPNTTILNKKKTTAIHGNLGQLYYERKNYKTGHIYF
ncbi:hypothetical protein QW71_35255 [Paenibacillus sp. IHB B 3415]|nr:hypothetical protein QW71_35255 [Paenibacillus sp. IHB B 3415]